MTLFDFDKIIKKKYIIYSNKKKIENKERINFDEFRNIGITQISKIFYFYFSGINQNYITNLFHSKRIKIVFSCIDPYFSLKNITSILIYHKTKSYTVNKYYILLLGTHDRFRKFGYGKVILNEFIDLIKLYNIGLNNTNILLLKSLDSSMNFYLDYGFIKSKSSLQTNKLFFKYETNEELKNNKEKILQFDI